MAIVTEDLNFGFYLILIHLDFKNVHVASGVCVSTVPDADCHDILTMMMLLHLSWSPPELINTSFPIPNQGPQAKRKPSLPMDPLPEVPVPAVTPFPKPSLCYTFPFPHCPWLCGTPSLANSPP